MGTVKQGWIGRFFDDFTEGDIYRSRIGRTITEADNIQFTLLTNNTNQIHFNADYASRTEFKRPHSRATRSTLNRKSSARANRSRGPHRAW